jgi:hypothetical protein
MQCLISLKNTVLFVWGGAINGFEWHGISYLNHLKNVKIGDILVAGGVLYIDLIGKVDDCPKYIPSEKNRKDTSFYETYGIGIEEDEDIVKGANEFNFEDMICIKTSWLKSKLDIKLSGLYSKLPKRQPPGGFQPLRRENINYILKILQ